MEILGDQKQLSCWISPSLKKDPSLVRVINHEEKKNHDSWKDGYVTILKDSKCQCYCTLGLFRNIFFSGFVFLKWSHGFNSISCW